MKNISQQVEAITNLTSPIEISAHIKKNPQIPRNETLQSSSNMTSFKIKCPQNGIIFLNLTQLHVNASIKVYFKNRSLTFVEILNENHSITINGTNEGFNSLYYKCSPIIESMVFMSIITTSSFRVDFSIELNTVQCLFWQTNANEWKADGCLVDAESSTFNRVHCKCNHLSFFAVKHYKSDYCANFPEATNAPMKSVIWICVLFILLLSLIIITWAWRRDKIDKNNLKLIYIKNEHISNPYYYAVTIVTGSMENANTTSHVGIKIHGHHYTPHIIPLFDRRSQLFQRGSVNTFIIKTIKCVGRINKITLCHDCSGVNPSWYCNEVIIHDLQRKEEWIFDVNRWFSTELGDKTIIASIDAITEKKYYTGKRLIRLHWTKLLHNSYSLFSICLRGIGGKLSRVERVYVASASIVFGLLSNVLFFNYSTVVEDENNYVKIILISAIIGFSTTLMIRLLLIYLLLKSKIKNRKRHWQLMFRSESI